MDIKQDSIEGERESAVEERMQEAEIKYNVDKRIT